MNDVQKRVVKWAALVLVGIQGVGVLFALSALRSVASLGVDVAYGSVLVGALVWPLLVGGAVFFSLRALFQESHYGWMGLIAAAVFTLPSLCFPASAVILYVLLNPAVRAPMLRKIDAEWGLSSNR